MKLTYPARTVLVSIVLWAVILITLTSCATQTVEEAVGVDVNDNAILCVNANYDAFMTDSGISYTRIELPAGLDLKSLTTEAAQALGQIAARLGC